MTTWLFLDGVIDVGDVIFRRIQVALSSRDTNALPAARIQYCQPRDGSCFLRAQ